MEGSNSFTYELSGYPSSQSLFNDLVLQQWDMTKTSICIGDILQYTGLSSHVGIYHIRKASQHPYQADKTHLHQVVISPAKCIGTFKLRSAIVVPEME